MDPLQVEQLLGYLQEISAWLEGTLAVLTILAVTQVIKVLK